MSRLRTRQPTGRVAWPLILVEGEDKAGKTHAALSFSADERVGRTFVLEVGESTADEYQPLGPFELIDHDGTYADMLDQLTAATEEPSEPGRPNVIVVDSASELWELLKNWASHRARSSDASKRKLAKDPDAFIDVSMNYWNDSSTRWWQVVNLLRKWDGIGILTCRGREVTKVEGGRPVTGQTDYSIDAKAGTLHAVKAHVRVTRPHTATLMAVATLGADLPAKGKRLPDTDPLGHLVFELMGATGGPSHLVTGDVGMTVVDAKHRLKAVFDARGVSDAREQAAAVWQEHGPGEVDEVSNDALARMVSAAEERLAARPRLVEDGAA